MKAMVIGRHSGEIPDIEVVETRSIQFPAQGQDCAMILAKLFAEARERGLAVIFQAVPGQVAVALNRTLPGCGVNVGVIVSCPGARPASVTRAWDVPRDWHDGLGDTGATVKEIVAFANPNAKCEVEGNVVQTVTVTVDPPMKFKFDHIEWF